MQSAAALCAMHTTGMTKMDRSRLKENLKKAISAKAAIHLFTVLTKPTPYLMLGSKTFFFFGTKNVSEAL